jgi:hypothetical protein
MARPEWVIASAWEADGEGLDSYLLAVRHKDSREKIRSIQCTISYVHIHLRAAFIADLASAHTSVSKGRNGGSFCRALVAKNGHGQRQQHNSRLRVSGGRCTSPVASRNFLELRGLPVTNKSVWPQLHVWGNMCLRGSVDSIFGPKRAPAFYPATWYLVSVATHMSMTDELRREDERGLE